MYGKNVEFLAYRSTNKTPLLNPDFSINSDDTIESYYDVKIYNNLQEVLDLNPNLAVISTPSSSHLKYAQICADKGVNILVEKPLSNSIDGVQKLIKTLEKNRVALRVGLQRRFHTHIKE